MDIIDTKMHGKNAITGAFVVRGTRTALVETGPKSSLEIVLRGLEDAGVESLDWIVVTHIHLDHAGAAGSLAQRFPNAKVAVHEVGAPHLVDPSKLWSSASRIYGERMEELWGGIDALAEDRIHVVRDGDVIDLGGRKLRAIETPGHARHHHAFLDDSSGVVFTGDSLGIRLQDVGLARPASPPPEFHLEDAIASIERLRGVGASAFCFTHFGVAEDIDRACDAAIEALRRWEGFVREARATEMELDDAAAYVRTRVEESFGDGVDDAAIARMEQTTSYWMNTWGYMRYLDKLAQAS